MHHHETYVRFWISPKWLCGNSCTCSHDVRLYITGTNEPKNAKKDKQEESYRWSQMIHDTQSDQISQK